MHTDLDDDKQRQGRNQKSNGQRKGKSAKPKKPAQSVVGNRLWTVEAWLKHG